MEQREIQIENRRIRPNIPSSKADETTKRRGQVGTEGSRTVVPGVCRVKPPADALDVVVLLVQPEVVRELGRVRRVSGGHTKDSSVNVSTDTMRSDQTAALSRGRRF